MDADAELPSGLNFLPHPSRARVLSEMHARPYAPIPTPRRVLHFGFTTDEATAHADRVALTAACAARGVVGPASGARYHRVAFSGAILRWERHSEFTTYTWELPAEGAAGAFHPTPDTLDGIMRCVPQPGPLLVAVDLHLLPEDACPDGVQGGFDPARVAICAVQSGRALVATDFQADPYGFVRLLLLDRGLAPIEAGTLVQHMLEIETYRMLALLGLPDARRLGIAISRIENELPTLLVQMQESEGLDANNRLLGRLGALAAELEAGAARTLFRFGATRAYNELLSQRLRAIGEVPVAGTSSFSGFLTRRLAPAIRTCASTEERQDTLSRKLTSAAQLLRTRVDVEMERQNGELLHAMHERQGAQLRMQLTVEGLSVAAISYYVANLVDKLLEGAHVVGLPLDPTLGTACAVPLVVLGVAWVVRRIRREHSGLS